MRYGYERGANLWKGVRFFLSYRRYTRFLGYKNPAKPTPSLPFP